MYILISPLDSLDYPRYLPLDHELVGRIPSGELAALPTAAWPKGNMGAARGLRLVAFLTMDFYLYMGLEVGGCSLFADPSGYVGTIISTTNTKNMGWSLTR